MNTSRKQCGIKMFHVFYINVLYTQKQQRNDYKDFRIVDISEGKYKKERTLKESAQHSGG
jgi:hypothetical protein